ncbi:non-ribosomal peptide synthetase [Micromonospora siamensis]|uniref:non-ribosomal peptide synthetase n=1 Tax=Micromonospora siamensis TaxID=299152 RepID=UPI00155FA0E1|nr:non-ribosomal peptide synthetase [Micromonospora siamensis]
MAAEYQRTINDWNNTTTAPPTDDTPTTLPALIEAQTRRTPEHIAVTSNSDQLTYHALNTHANQLARHLITHGVGPESIVAVCLPRSTHLLTALLAVLKTGAAYLPLDPDYPGARTEFMLHDANPTCVITDTHTAPQLPTTTPHITIDDPHTTTHQPTTNPTDTDRHQPLTPTHPAYVIYTSGSTGKPKGVVITHEGIVNRLRWMQHQFGIGPGDRIMQKTPYGFDVSVWELFWPLMQGAAVVMALPGGHRDPAYLANEIEQTGTDIVHFVPSMLREFLEHPDAADCRSLRHIVCSGEALGAHTLRRVHDILPGCTVTNLYGPTEAAVDVTCWESAGAASVPSSVPIGRPVWNTQVYVLDNHTRPVPIGTPGELYLAGIQLARGYLNRPALTAERFVASPYGPPGARMYRTGDLVRWNPDGTLEYLGRTDDQVKLRGFRIELGEIETTLCTHPTITHAVAMVREDQPGDQRLVAYLVPTPDTTINTDDLHHHLTQTLPEHMIPTTYLTLTHLPLTGNGKLDRKALPTPPTTTATPHGRQPRTPHEKTLCQLYTQILNVPHITIDDSFFTLGGHSLLATRLAAKIRHTLGINTTVRDIFDHPTPATLATTLTHQHPHHRPTLTPRNRTTTVPMSFAQRRLWFLDQLQGTSATYNVPVAVRLTGTLDRSAMSAALRDVVGRHEVLRTVLREVDDDAVQVVLPVDSAEVPLTCEHVDVGEFGAARRRASRHLFRLDTDVPVRAFLFSANAPELDAEQQEHLLVLVVHHVATDGWSRGPLLRDLARAYAARIAGGVADWAPLPVQYADFALWQQELLGDHEDPDSLQGRQLRYWRDRMAGAPAELNLPHDRPRPPTASHRGGGVRFSVSPQLHARLLALAAECDATLFMVVHAAMALLLSRLGAGDDVVLGTPTAGRSDEELDDLVGFFVNTLVLRTDLSGDPTFRGLVERVRAADSAAFAHQDLPFEHLVEQLSPERSQARHPLFQTSLVFETDDVDTDSGSLAVEFPGLRSVVLPDDPEDTDAAKFDLSLSVTERLSGGRDPGGLSGLWTYARDLYDQSTVRMLSDRFVEVLQRLVADPDQRVGGFDVISDTEYQRTINDWNNTTTAPPTDDTPTTLPALIEAQTRRTPEHIAVTSNSDQLTYHALNTHANQLARHLITHGVGPESIVAVCLPRSTHLLTALLAVLKTGAAYLPLDPDYPGARTEFMLHDANPTCVITDTHTAPQLPTTTPHITIDDPHTTTHQPTTNPTDTDRHQPLTPTHPAYVIYTSGSTGKPKGVVITHEGIVNYLRWSADTFRCHPGAESLVLTSVAFDLAVTAVFPPLTRGGTVRLLDRDEAREPTRLVPRLSGDHAAGLVKATPSHLRELVSAVAEAGQEWSAGAAVVAGELFATGDLHRLRELRRPGCGIFNSYGPTEATVACVVFDTDEPWTTRARSVPIGRPVWNTQVYVLDNHTRPVPIGTPGELYLAGIQLARGYLNRPALTAERFVASPYGPPGARMYRTGDLVRWNPDGTLEYLGRTDDQVKLRGFRIELGEIETTLCTHPTITHAVAMVREDQPGDQRLVAYLVPTPDTTINTDDLHHHLTQTLPEHMIPTTYLTLTHLPLTGNGKLDRKALPTPPTTTATPHGRQPRTPHEKTLCQLYTQILNVPHITIDDSFFTLGGHSLLATRLAAKIRHTLGINTTVRDIFDHPTPATLATTLTHQHPHHRPTLTPRNRTTTVEADDR